MSVLTEMFRERNMCTTSPFLFMYIYFVSQLHPREKKKPAKKKPAKKKPENDGPQPISPPFQVQPEYDKY